MTAAISFKDVSVDNFFDHLSFEVEPGNAALIITSGEAEGAIILRLITGMSRPSRGSVQVAGQPLAEMSPTQMYHLRQQIGVVPSNGGLISNLKLWENITLPLIYTTGHISGEMEDSAVNQLRALGYSGILMAMPAHLTLHEKRVAAFLRATLCQPNIMLYGNCFEDVSNASRKAFSTAAAEFHAAVPDRTSLFLASSADTARVLPVDCIISVHEHSETMAGTL